MPASIDNATPGQWPQVPWQPSGLAEYDENAFLRALPPVPTESELYKHLMVLPPCHPHERQLPRVVREQAVFVRLRRFVLPTPEQLRHAFQIDLMIRSGYVGRSPATGAFAAQLTRLGCDTAADEEGEQVIDLRSEAADSLVAIGPSGMGKTTMLRAALSAYKQVVRHTTPITMTQVVWIRLECPGNGSLRQMCINFFDEVDRLTGRTYLSKFGKLNVDQLTAKVRLVAAKHAIGLVTIDEVQHLCSASVGREQVLALLTTFVNVVGIPILMIGTTKAHELFHSAFRLARRGEGVGSLLINPMAKDDDFRAFLKILFGFQWTTQRTELSDDLIDVIWEESQGIIDIVKKLYILSQMRAIRTGERTGSELITTDLVRTVAKENLQLVRPMLDALRRKDLGALAQFDDLMDLNISIAAMLQERYGVDALQPDLTGVADEIEKRLESPDGEMASSLLVSALAAQGFDARQIADMVAKVAEVRAAVDPTARSADVKLASPSRSRKPTKPADVDPSEGPDGIDLRVTLAGGLTGNDAEQRLREAGIDGREAA
jgi:energy-coupling factor transporter ATP-binding protein EcfA2